MLRLLLALLPSSLLLAQEFVGRRVLVVGSSAGMGRAAAELVYQRGGSVVYSGRDSNKLRSAVENKDPGRAFAIKCDAGNETELAMLVEEAARRMGGLDGLVWVPNFLDPVMFPPLDEAIARGTAREALRGCLLWNAELLLQTFILALPHLKQSNQSSVVAISSVAAKSPGLRWAHSVGKATEDALCENMAYEYAGRGIRVNCFQAGPFLTDFAPSEEVKRWFEREMMWRTPYGRAGKPEEAAEFITFLLSNR